MTWIKVEDTFPEHPKAEDLSYAAMGVWLFGLCYANRLKTDGHVSRTAVFRRGDSSTNDGVAELVAAGLWVPTETGWAIHDYLEYQRSRAQIQGLSEARSAAGRKGGQATPKQNASKTQANPKQNASKTQANPKQNPSKTQAEEKRGDEKRGDAEEGLRSPVLDHANKQPVDTSPSSGATSNGTTTPAKDIGQRADGESDDIAFAEFWQRYPRKVGKADARRAWAKATKHTDPQTILHGLDRLLPALTETHQRDPRYVPHPATWLNADRWLDEAPATTTPKTAKQLEAEKVRAILLALSSDSGTHGGTPPGSAPPPTSEDGVIDATWAEVF